MVQFLAEIIGRKWNRPVRIPTPAIEMRPTPLQIQEESLKKFQQSSSVLKWPKSTGRKSRYNPMKRSCTVKPLLDGHRSDDPKVPS